MPILPSHESREKRRFKYFGESNGHLQLTDQIYGPGSKNLRLFEMEKDYSRWFCKYLVNLDPLFDAFPCPADKYFFKVSRLEMVSLSIFGKIHGSCGCQGKFLI